jgi:hypothetical protein
MKRAMSFVVVLLLALPASCSRTPESPDQAKAPVSVYHDRQSFIVASGKLTEIDFESQPWNGSSACNPPGPTCTPITNPLVLDGVSFTSPGSLWTGFCSSPTCEPDPHNSSQGNITLSLDPGGTIDFPANTGGVLLDIQGIGDNPFQIKVTDALNNTRTLDGVGVSYGVTYLGFTSLVGISRVEVVSVGGTGGPLVLAAVVFGFHR